MRLLLFAICLITVLPSCREAKIDGNVSDFSTGVRTSDVLLAPTSIPASTTKISQIDSTLIGLELDKALALLETDSNSLGPFDEPPMILRGVWGTLTDSTEAILYVERTASRWYESIKHKKVIGLAWADIKGNTKCIGKNIAYYNVTNRYYKKERK